MASAVVQDGFTNADASDANVTLGSNVTVGNTIVVETYQVPDAIGTPVASDNLGNTYTPIISQNYHAGEVRAWFAPITTGGSCTVKLTLATATFDMLATEISGLSSTPADVSAGAFASGGSSVATVTTATTTQADEMVRGYAANTAVSWTAADAGYTEQRKNIGGVAGEIAFYKNVSATGTQVIGATLSGAVSWGLIGYTLKDTGGGGGGGKPWLYYAQQRGT